MKSDWKYLKFSSAPLLIIDGDRGKNYPTQGEFYDDEYCLFLNTGNVTSQGFNFSKCQFITREKDMALRKGKLNRKDIVMTTRGTIGNIGFYGNNVPYENVRINSGMVILRTKEQNLLPNFLYYYLRSPVFYLQVNSIRTGSAQPQLPIRNIYCLKIPIPSIRVQDRIASILSAYDDLIENNLTRIELLERAARLLYEEWFVRLRFPGHESVRVVDGVPEGWEKSFVPNAIEINPKTAIKSGSSIKYIPMASLSETSMVVNKAQIEIREKVSGAIFTRFDTLLARITPCLENGKTAFVNFLEENEVACGSTEFIVLRGKRISPEFVYCLARTYEFREKAIKSMIGSSGRQRVQTSCFDDFQIFVPSDEIKNEFVSITEPMFLQIEKLVKQNEKIEKACNLLLPRLMSGEIEV